MLVTQPHWLSSRKQTLRWRGPSTIMGGFLPVRFWGEAPRKRTFARAVTIDSFAPILVTQPHRLSSRKQTLRRRMPSTIMVGGFPPNRTGDRARMTPQLLRGVKKLAEK